MPDFGRRNGYKTFIDPETGEEVFVHRRVMEKKLGGPIPDGRVVHHRNGHKDDNRPSNLVAVSPSVHWRLHNVDENVCYRCGESGHWASACPNR